jgi:hypothetical protein
MKRWALGVAALLAGPFGASIALRFLKRLLIMPASHLHSEGALAACALALLVGLTLLGGALWIGRSAFPPKAATILAAAWAAACIAMGSWAGGRSVMWLLVTTDGGFRFMHGPPRYYLAFVDGFGRSVWLMPGLVALGVGGSLVCAGLVLVRRLLGKAVRPHRG